MSAPALPAHVDDALSANLDRLDRLAGNARALVSEYRLRRASAQGPSAAGNGGDLSA